MKPPSTGTTTPVTKPLASSDISHSKVPSRSSTLPNRPCGVAARINDLFDNPQVQARDMIIELNVEGAGKVPYPGMPIKLSDTPCSVHYENFQLGAATEDIMTNLLGYTQEEFETLRADHIV